MQETFSANDKYFLKKGVEWHSLNPCPTRGLYACTKATGIENRPSARIALRGKSYQFPTQHPKLSIRVLYNRKMARQSFLRFLLQLNGGKNYKIFITVQPLDSPNLRLASWTDFNARRLRSARKRLRVSRKSRNVSLSY
jgi:hypothetical protein